MGGMKDQLIAQIESGEARPAPSISSHELGAAVRYHRRKAGLTQLDLAKLAGVGKTAVFDIEKSKPSVQLDTLLKVLRVLNVTIAFQSPLMERFVRECHAKG